MQEEQEQEHGEIRIGDEEANGLMQDTYDQNPDNADEIQNGKDNQRVKSMELGEKKQDSLNPIQSLIVASGDPGEDSHKPIQKNDNADPVSILKSRPHPQDAALITQ